MKLNIKTYKQLHYKLLALGIFCASFLVFSSAVAYHYLNRSPKPVITISTNHAPTATKPIAKKPNAQVTQSAPGTTTPAKPQPTTVTPSPKPAGPSLDAIVASINQSLQPYGVTATLAPPNNAYTYSTWSALDNNDAATLNQFSNYLTSQFTKYKIDLVLNSGLKTIGLVKNLKVSGGARAAVPAPSISGMLYDTNVMTNSGSAYAEEVVSHEYWHYLDYKMQASYTYDDAQWDICNPGGFTYGSGGSSAYGADSGYVSAFHPTTGFITAYSEYAIEEDRAEMFGWLIYNPSGVKNLGDTDINCKINRLTAIVHQLSPSMSF